MANKPTQQEAAEVLAEILFDMIDLGDCGPCDYEPVRRLDEYIFNNDVLEMEPVREKLNQLRKEWYG